MIIGIIIGLIIGAIGAYFVANSSAQRKLQGTKSQLERANKAYEEAERQAQAAQRQLQSVEDSYQSQVDRLEQSYQGQQAELEQANTRLQEINLGHQARIKELERAQAQSSAVEDAQSQIQELQQVHAGAIAELETTHQTQLRDLESAYQSQILDLQQVHNDEIRALQEQPPSMGMAGLAGIAAGVAGLAGLSELRDEETAEADNWLEPSVETPIAEEEMPLPELEMDIAQPFASVEESAVSEWDGLLEEPMSVPDGATSADLEALEMPEDQVMDEIAQLNEFINDSSDVGAENQLETSQFDNFFDAPSLEEEAEEMRRETPQFDNFIDVESVETESSLEEISSPDIEFLSMLQTEEELEAASPQVNFSEAQEDLNHLWSEDAESLPTPDVDFLEMLQTDDEAAGDFSQAPVLEGQDPFTNFFDANGESPRADTDEALASLFEPDSEKPDEAFLNMLNTEEETRANGNSTSHNGHPDDWDNLFDEASLESGQGDSDFPLEQLIESSTSETH